MSRSTDGHRGRSSTEPTIIALLALLAGLPAAAQEEAPGDRLVRRGRGGGHHPQLVVAF